jgi:hypothetical protein
MPHPEYTFEHLLAVGWTSRLLPERIGAQTCRVTLMLWDRHGNILSECTGEGLTIEVARQLAANRANAFLFRTQRS